MSEEAALLKGATEVSKADESSESRKAKILVVEDQRKVADFLVHGLEEEGYVVRCVMRGDEVSSALETETCDLLVLDVMLPGKTGFEIAQDLRMQGNSIPILMLTARDQLFDRLRGFEAGADDYLAKPFAFAELLARIQALLRRAHASDVSLLVLADLAVEPLSRKVTREGKSIELTAKEYALLEFMLRNKHRVVTRSELLSNVWGIQFDPKTNVVDVLIRALRGKVDEPFSKPLIHTVRGAGYLLSDEKP